MTRCIFCRSDTSPPYSEEHIIPVALGGQDDLVLDTGQVCQACNARLGKADTGLINYLRPLLPYAGVRNRKGRWQGFTSDSVTMTRTEFNVHVDVQVKQAEPDGPRVKREGDQVRVSFSLAAPSGGLLERGLHKIAFEFACGALGADTMLDSRFDALRAYILGTRSGFRHVLIQNPDGLDLQDIQTRHGVVTIAPFGDSPLDYLVSLMLCGLAFEVAVTPDHTAILDYGRTQNRRLGRTIFFSLDSAGRVMLL